MNKKFFAALASATMAFTASSSIAVFADDFVEEANILDGNDVKPVEKTVKWDEEHFGGFVKVADATWNGKKPAVDKDGYVKTDDLKKVETITLQQYFEDEIKGLEYFTGLKEFDASNGKKITNKTLDFSTNTKLETLKVNVASDLTGVVLPEAFVNEDEEEVYSLKTLEVQNTKLTSLDFSAQQSLESVRLDNNRNLKDVTVAKGTKANPHTYSYFNISVTSLETIDLENCKFTGTFALDNNRLGVLDLSKTTIDTKATVYLQDQTLYISESLATINVKDTFDDVDTHDFAATGYNKKTGVLDLEKNDGKYEYTTADKGDTARVLKVNIVKANPMNRLYNPNSGEHFYTADIKEKEALVKLGWNDEGYGWVAPTTDDKDTNKGNPVYRLYNPNAGDHHYTMNAEERDVLVAYGWKDEKTGWYSASDTADKVAVYRQYNPYANGAGSHNYTTDKAENDYLVSVGWIYEGTCWSALR